MRVDNRLTETIDTINARVGRAVAWLAVAMVLVQFSLVVMRHVFSLGSVALQETVTYIHALLFMAGAGYTLLKDGHVRVDVIYERVSDRSRAWIDLCGALLLVLPVSAVTVWLSWSYVTASWAVLEGSSEAGGLPLVFVLKTVIWLFAGLLALQGIALGTRAWARLRQSERPR